MQNSDNMQKTKLVKVYIANLDCSDTIPFTKEISIAPLDTEEKSKHKRRHHTDRYFFLDTKSNAIITFDEPMDLQKAREKTDAITWRLITSLRLMKTGYIGEMDAAYYTSINNPSYAQTWRNWGETTIANYGEPYSLKEEDAERLRQIWKLIENISPTIRTALLYYNFSYSKPELYYKIVDLVIALESIFGIEHESKHRMSLYTSALIGKNSPDKKRIFDTMKNAYEARSKVVHGKDPSEIPKKIGIMWTDLASDTEDFARRVLLKCMEMGMTGESLCKHIEENLLF